jgi:hypothetical protein
MLSRSDASPFLAKVLSKGTLILNAVGIIFHENAQPPTQQDNPMWQQEFTWLFAKKRREAPAFMPGMDRRWARRAQCPRAQQDPRSA